MRIEVQWSWALSLVCEVALKLSLNPNHIDWIYCNCKTSCSTCKKQVSELREIVILYVKIESHMWFIIEYEVVHP